MEPAGRSSEPAGRASEPAERAPKPAGRASEPGGRPRGEGGTEKKERKKNNEAFIVCGGTIGHRPLRGRCPKGELVEWGWKRETAEIKVADPVQHG